MINYLRLVPSLLLMFISLLGYSQPILQGEWRDHLSYRHCYRITDIGNVVYCSSESGLISYNKNSKELRTHSKITGLSDVLISSIAYSEITDKLIIGYTNGNIDLIHEGGDPVNISDIKRKIMTADKRINQIYTHGETAYLACGFGIVVLNHAKNEIKETYILGENGAFLEVNDVTILGNNLYAATVSGIFTADLDSSNNLLDYNNWSQIDFIPNSQEEYKFVEVHNNKLFAVYSKPLIDKEEENGEDFIITISENNFQNWSIAYDSQISDISSVNGFLTISSPSRGLIYNENELLYADISTVNNQHIFVSKEMQIFVASSYSGFLRKDNPNDDIHYLVPNGPRFSEVSKVSTFEDQIWVSSGGPNRLYRHGGMHSFIDNNWDSYIGANIPGINSLGNIHKIAIDPRNPDHIFAGSFGYGLFEIRDKEVIGVYDYDNTEAFNGISQGIGIRVSGIQFDSQSNLYFILSLVSSPLFKVDPEGNWTQLDINNPLLSKTINYADLLITSRGQIWLLSNLTGIVVLEDQGDGSYRDKSFIIKNQFGNLLTHAYCLEEDNEGNIWVGTNNGPIIYYSPWNIFENDEVTGYQIPIPRNDGTDLIDPLLYSEAILDIETNGGNQKWLATDQSGVFLIDEDGKTTIHNFREENSPLLSNGVSGIGINSKTGEVYFATDQGLVSYGGIATEGFSHYSQVYAYPNPVRHDYEGPITITGLIENSVVKITNVSGNLVWETTSLGGQAVWDGRNFNGVKVASGVYLIMLATEDGLESHITKLLFLH